jgi:hypothetical protein
MGTWIESLRNFIILVGTRDVVTPGLDLVNGAWEAEAIAICEANS